MSVLTKRAVITVPVAPMLVKPELYSELADEVLHGYVVELLSSCEKGYFLVKAHYNYTGYVHESMMNVDEGAADLWAADSIYTVGDYSVDVHDVAKVQGGIIITLTKGCGIILIGSDENGWTKVLTANGTEGYMRSKFIGSTVKEFDYKNCSASEQEAFREKLVDTAFEYMKTQYRWGGKTPQGIDCSGLCAIAYLLNGVTIHRDASIKEEFPVKEIKKDEIKKGDLIFFPGHVAMYIEDGRYIHSSASNDGVYLNSLNTAHSDYRQDLAEKVKAYGSIF